MNEVYAALLGAITGFIVTYFTSSLLLQSQRRLEAASKFREAFSEEIARCKHPQEIKIKHILIEAMIKHEKAVILYEPFIEKSKKTDFKNTWNKYCELNMYSNLNSFTPEAGLDKEGYIREMSEKEQKENSLAHLTKLIEYASIN